MSRMIPPFCDEDTSSNAEIKVFQMLESLDERYTILHSLGIARHANKIYGEIDFVVICGEGILCLEVKGGRVYRKEGVWVFTDRNDVENRRAESPFQQVLSAMHSLRESLQNRFGKHNPISECLYACGVVFPDMKFTLQDPEVIPEIVFDSRWQKDRIAAYINQAYCYWRKKLETRHGIRKGNLDEESIKKIIGYLRGDFGFVPSLGYIIEHTEERLLELTAEQVERLTIADENPRVLLKGCAGTGKTLLSMEYARRHAIAGDDVLFICFNHNLAVYLRSLIEREDLGLTSKLVVETFHGYIIGCLKRDDLLPADRTESGTDYYRNVLPEAFLEAGHDIGDSDRFDVLVVDEGQDLLIAEYIMCLDSMTKGGLQNGSWHISYDPNQNIYNPEFNEGMEFLLDFNPTRLSLDTNCRNTRPVGIYNTLFTGMEPAQHFRVDGINVELKPFKDYEDERNLIRKEIRKLRGQGIKPAAICLLSKFSIQKSCLQGTNICKGICSFIDITRMDHVNLSKDSVKFCTIQSFKGLEAPVVMLIDVVDFKDMQSRLLNYTAISRAISMLYVFYSKNADEEMRTMMEKNAELLEHIKG